MDLSGKIALVTGGSRGIGRAIAIALADTGAHVAVNYKENKTAAEEVVTAITKSGRRAIAIGADVSILRKSNRWSRRSRSNSAKLESWSTMPAWRAHGRSKTSISRCSTKRSM